VFGCSGDDGKAFFIAFLQTPEIYLNSSFELVVDGQPLEPEF